MKETPLKGLKTHKSFVKTLIFKPLFYRRVHKRENLTLFVLNAVITGDTTDPGAAVPPVPAEEFPHL